MECILSQCVFQGLPPPGPRGLGPGGPKKVTQLIVLSRGIGWRGVFEYCKTVVVAGGGYLSGR